MVVIEKLNIRLLIVESDKEPYEKTVRNRLDKFRQIIGNENIEVIVFDEDTLLIFDADAFINNVKVNRITTEEYKTKAIRPKNSRLSKKSLIESNFSLFPTWKDALKRYIEELKEHNEN